MSLSLYSKNVFKSLFCRFRLIVNLLVHLNILKWRLHLKSVVSGCFAMFSLFWGSAGDINAYNLSHTTGTNWARRLTQANSKSTLLFTTWGFFSFFNSVHQWGNNPVHIISTEKSWDTVVNSQSAVLKSELSSCSVRLNDGTSSDGLPVNMSCSFFWLALDRKWGPWNRVSDSIK